MNSIKYSEFLSINIPKDQISSLNLKAEDWVISNFYSMLDLFLNSANLITIMILMSFIKVLLLLQGSIRINIIIQTINKYLKSSSNLFLISTLVVLSFIVIVQRGFVFNNNDFLDITKVLFNTIKTIFGIWGIIDFKNSNFYYYFTTFYLLVMFAMKLFCLYFFLVVCNSAFDEVLVELKEYKKRKIHGFLGDLFRDYLFYCFFPLCLPVIIYQLVILRRTYKGMDCEECLERMDHRCKLFFLYIKISFF